MDYEVEEERDGLRFSWNVWPASRVEGTRLVAPVACCYTPLKAGVPTVTFPPVHCKQCKAVLNPFCGVDVKGKIWACPFCLQRNSFPQTYADISETNMPVELFPKYTTIEYLLDKGAIVSPPAFLFVVDTCLPDDELSELKNSLILSLSLIPENSLVGLITYGRSVQVYELSSEDMPKCYVFNGAKEFNGKQIQDMLGIGSKGGAMTPQLLQQLRRRFLQPLNEVELTFTSLLEDLQRDPYPVKNDRRPLRATGAALSVALGMLEGLCPNLPARAMVFTGGPITYGPGQMVGEELKETLRSHTDLVKETAKYSRKAQKYYEGLSKRAAETGHGVDVFMCSMDQCGFYELQDVVKRTGGFGLVSDGFGDKSFKDSFQKLFGRDEKGFLPQGFQAVLEVLPSRELKVCGAIGHCASLGKKSGFVSETEIGIGGTSAWRLSSVDPHSSYALYFETIAQQPLQPNTRGHIQFTTQYINSAGQKVLRVTTCARGWSDGSSNTTNGGSTLIAQGFDQEAAAVIMARIAVFKSETEEAFDILRWIDRMLIRLVQKFGDYRKDDPSSFALTQNFAIYPQFMFHLRRSPFLQVFNNSPDETAFYRYMLNRESVGNSLIMIQPTLEAYSFSAPPGPVLLASTSVTPDRILVLDTFFRIIVHQGETIASWRKAGYAEDPKHENFKKLLQAPKDEALALMKKRWPTPTLVECDQHTSQARFLKATIDPVVTHTSGNSANSGGEMVWTDDVSLKVFLEHLKKVSVQS